MGLCSYYMRFVNGFAAIEAPLTNPLKNGALNDFSNEEKSFILPVEAKRAFQKLRVALTTTPLLTVVDSDMPWVVYPDAS